MSTKRSIAICLALFALALAGWSFYSFFDSRTNISELIAEIPQDEIDLPETVSTILKNADVLEKDSSGDLRLFMRAKDTQGMRKLEIKAHEITWRFWVSLLYTESQRLSIYAHLMPFKNGQGLSYASKYYFAKTVDELSTDEILKLVVISRSPARYDVIESDELLEKETVKLKESLAF